ncbi:MAG: CsbD family protein, partial [Methylobacterium organophilum]|nr:CsbD family protein [Methylobacterium organophilum]
VRHAAEEAYDVAEDAYARGSRALRRGTREVGEQVAAYPLPALLVAGIAGFGLGLLVSARRA